MPDAQGPKITLAERVATWRRLAERHAKEDDPRGYRLYGGDWASLAVVLAECEESIVDPDTKVADQ